MLNDWFNQIDHFHEYVTAHFLNLYDEHIVLYHILHRTLPAIRMSSWGMSIPYKFIIESL